jgi:hypothetical protein
LISDDTRREIIDELILVMAELRHSKSDRQDLDAFVQLQSLSTRFEWAVVRSCRSEIHEAKRLMFADNVIPLKDS